MRRRGSDETVRAGRVVGRRKPKNLKLPGMQCDLHCAECCGPVIVTTQEFNCVITYARKSGVRPRRQGFTCPWFQAGRCLVYDARPTICRLFGHVPNLVCPRGYNVNVPRKVERYYMKQCGTPTKVLHQVFSNWEEILKSSLRLPLGSKIDINPDRIQAGPF